MVRKIVVGISGASGIPLAVKLLQKLKNNPEVQTHLVITAGAKITLKYESDCGLDEILALADVVYENDEIGAAIASGTFKTDGMIVIPCSMKTVAGIAAGYGDNLLQRACDVMIKEKRQLVLVARESPLSAIHLDNLAYLARLPNVAILPPMLAYYQKPQTIADLENNVIGKILSQFDIDCPEFVTWK